jgi:S1-C subfamily serine protease
MTLHQTLHTFFALPIVCVILFVAPFRNTEAKGYENGNTFSQSPLVGVVFPEDENDDAWVTEVPAGGPAGKAGLKAGDTITKINDERIKTVKQFREAIKEHKPKDVVKFTVRRGTDFLTLSVTLGQAP